MKRIICICALMFLPLLASAQPETLTPQLILNHIKAFKTSETQDEIYFDIAIYKGNQQVQLVRVPQKPNHWPSSYLNKLQSIPLWQEPIKTGEKINLIVSLVESDDSVMNPDDLIGSVKLELQNNNGVLETNWGVPNREGPAQTESVQKFILKSHDAQYEVDLSLK